MDFKFWIPAIGLPLIAVFANVLVRVLHGLSQSALADMVLCFAVFDAVVTIQSEDFGKLVHLFAPESVPSVFVTLLIISLIVWFLLVVKVEKPMAECFESPYVSAKLRGMGLLLLSGVSSTAVIFLSLSPFI
ncbi:hypothetical protein [Bradyrhizobium liaoningense]